MNNIDVIDSGYLHVIISDFYTTLYNYILIGYVFLLYAKTTEDILKKALA